MKTTTSALESRPDLADDRRFRHLGLAVVLAVFGGLGTWAAVAPLSSAAVAPGIITVESYRKTVQHLEGGMVKAIHVRDGDAVTRGQILVTLDDTQPRAQLEVLRGQLYVALAREARLFAQRDGLGQVGYAAILLDNRQDDRVRDAIRGQDQTFMARKLAQDGEISLYQQQIGQLQARARGLSAQRQSQDQLARSYAGELRDFNALLEEGYADRQKVRELERNLSQSVGQHAQLGADMAATELQIGEIRLKIIQLKKELQKEVALELSEVQAELFGLREKLQSVQATVERTEVRAPEDGTVLGLSVHTIGAVIPPGGRILEVVPQKEKLLVEAQVSPLDIDRIQVGQTAEVRFTAFKTRDVAKIEGKLVAVSADRLLDDKEKTPFYLARIEVTPEGLEVLSRQNLGLVPGMPAEILINTGSRTPLQYVTQPFQNAFARSFTED